MAIRYPPQYRYALFEAWDRRAFKLIGQIAHKKKYPKIIGSQKDRNQFLITLIRTQKLPHSWRDFLRDILEQIEKSASIDTASLNQKNPQVNIGKGKPDWVTYKEDEIVSNFIDELYTRRIDFAGTDEEMSEFVMRFILGQLGHDWEQTIYMIWEILGDEKQINFKELNQEMRHFDYLGLFD